MRNLVEARDLEAVENVADLPAVGPELLDDDGALLRGLRVKRHAFGKTAGCDHRIDAVDELQDGLAHGLDELELDLSLLGVVDREHDPAAAVLEVVRGQVGYLGVLEQ